MNKDLFYKQLVQEEKDLLETLEAIRVLKKRYEIGTKPQTFISFEEAEHNLTATRAEYDQEWTQKEKTFWALNYIRKGTAEEVARVLLNFDEEFNGDKAFDVATIKLSKLYRDGIIGATKVGKKYRYYVIDNHTIDVVI